MRIAGLCVVMSAACGRFGFNSRAVAVDAGDASPAGDDAADAAPSDAAVGCGDASACIIGYSVQTGTWNMNAGTYYAQAMVAWTGAVPTDQSVSACTPAATCSVTGSGNATTVKVVTSPNQEASWITAQYVFSATQAVTGVTFQFDATAPPAIPTIYPPGPYDRVQAVLASGGMQVLPTLTCTPPDPYYYNSVTITITCTW